MQYNQSRKKETYHGAEKNGAFLKHLRNEKGLTQEQLAQTFYVAARAVSRWETEKNLPDLSILIELADFYEVDIRELMNGERKSENINTETKDTLLRVAEYADEEKKQLKRRFALSVSALLLLVLSFLVRAVGRAWIPENIYDTITSFSDGFIGGFVFAVLVINILRFAGVFEKKARRRQRERNNR